MSYAPADRSHLEALEAHLAALKRRGLVSTWHHGRIGAGAARDESIAAGLSAAEVVVLLVSEAFLASDSCYERELCAALERHRHGAARVVPILVRACDREGTALADLQALPQSGAAVTSWANPDEAWSEVVRGIRAAVEEAAVSARPEAGPARVAPMSALAAPLREAEGAIRAIDRQLAVAQKRRVRLRAAGASTAEVDQEIVDLRRKRREGGQLHVGEELSEGRCLLLERIGRGGFATVWRALDAGRAMTGAAWGTTRGSVKTAKTGLGEPDRIQDELPERAPRLPLRWPRPLERMILSVRRPHPLACLVYRCFTPSGKYSGSPAARSVTRGARFPAGT
ncbi:toll/interleukin-1 receptor domain-containing protein [Sorangium sp. So ce1036]|uniref:toll/interleukin-1 receptor domain-containing protein n=1 Tax=Sorangium sp. So ce1036 TaxID=3133328 RepID=UPI003F008276